MPRLSVRVVALVLTLPVPALAREVVYQFRSEEEPQAVADPRACLAAPFPANVQLLGRIFVPEESSEDGKVRSGDQRRLGTALACVRITDRSFSEGSQVDIYARFELPEGRFVAVGQCTALSNTVPRPGVVLAGCALKLTGFPTPYVGGFATSSSLFNPLHLPGYNTGSFWTLRLFEPEPAAPGSKARAPSGTK